jgi:hypothetical protein
VKKKKEAKNAFISKTNPFLNEKEKQWEGQPENFSCSSCTRRG